MYRLTAFFSSPDFYRLRPRLQTSRIISIPSGLQLKTKSEKRSREKEGASEVHPSIEWRSIRGALGSGGLGSSEGSSKKGMISDVGVPRELWTPACGAIDCFRPNELPANPLEGKPDRLPTREGHWLMFFCASLRSALWISRSSLRFLDPLYTFAFRSLREAPRAIPRCRKRVLRLDRRCRKENHKEIWLRHLCISPAELYFLEKWRSKANNALSAFAATAYMLTSVLFVMLIFLSHMSLSRTFWQ